jgi:hypothetical protein
MDPANSLAPKDPTSMSLPGLTGGENQPRFHTQIPVPDKIELAPNGWISWLARHGVSPGTSINLARYGLPAVLGIGTGLSAFKALNGLSDFKALNALEKRKRRMGSLIGGMSATYLASYLADRYATPAALAAGITRSPGEPVEISGPGNP